MFIQQLRALLDLLPVAYPSKDNRSKVYSSSCRYYGDPNGINMENVNKAILRKDETYYHYISYSFSNK